MAVCLWGDFAFAHKAELDYGDDTPRSCEHRGLGLWDDTVRFAWAMRLWPRCRIKWDEDCRNEPRGIAGCLSRNQ